MNEIPEGMKALRDEMAACIRKAGSSTTNRNRASALLAPGGPLWPALRALGKDAIDWVDLDTFGQGTRRERRRWLENVHGITGPLASACLAAAEAQS